jgi:hypothetical protein
MNSIIDKAQERKREYSQGADRPLGSYAILLTAFGAAVGAGAVIAKLTGRRSVELRPWDIALMTVTTYRASRVLAKGPVTSPLRAPFTRYEGTSGPSELAEEVHGTGFRHAVGELLTCPFCLAQWVAAAYVGGMAFAPHATRLVGTTMCAVAGADWLQLIHARLEQQAEGSPPDDGTR